MHSCNTLKQFEQLQTSWFEISSHLNYLSTSLIVCTLQVKFVYHEYFRLYAYAFIARGVSEGGAIAPPPPLFGWRAAPRRITTCITTCPSTLRKPLTPLIAILCDRLQILRKLLQMSYYQASLASQPA